MKRAFAALLTIAILLSIAAYPLPAAAEEAVCSVLTSAGLTSYDSIADAMQHTEPDSLLTLLQDTAESIVVPVDMTMDLNGFSVAGQIAAADGCTLQIMDSQTDDYTVENGNGYGKVSALAENVVPASNYLQITEADGISFHRISLQLLSSSLRCSDAGVYYTGRFCGDEVVAGQVKYYGIALRLSKLPNEEYMREGAACSWFTNFVPGAEGNTGSSTLLHNIISPSCSTAENTNRAQSGIYARPYIQMEDGRYVFGAGKLRSLMQQVQEADSMWYKLTIAQRTEFDLMYAKYSAIMENWYLPNRNNTDIDVPL